MLWSMGSSAALKSNKKNPSVLFNVETCLKGILEVVESQVVYLLWLTDNLFTELAQEGLFETGQ